MRLGLNQPYFFPYIGHFSLIKQVDIYIIDDVVQYTDKSWMSRNRVLAANGGWQYIRVPVKKHKVETPIFAIEIDNDRNWKSTIIKQLDYYRRAPYYTSVRAMIDRVFAANVDRLAVLNTMITREVCAYLGIETPVYVLSSMDVKYEPPQEADEWGRNICLALPNITEYWNAPGGAQFYKRSKYEEAGIKICFEKMIIEEYPQKGGPFEPGLSILDVMMFNSPEKINKMMDHFDLV